MRNRLLLIIVIALCLTCFSMGLFSVSMSIKKNDEQKKVPTIIESNKSSDFDNVGHIDVFDVNDFSENVKNTIDIKSKVYEPNTITILDSDFKLSEELEKQVYDILNNYGAASSFHIVSLSDGMSIGYNVDRKYETASSVKAPYALSVAREIAKGNIDKNKLITYKEKHHSIGTGVIKQSEFGTEYTVEELIKYSLHESDNIAHMMLHDEFGVSVYNKHLRDLGASELSLTVSNPWGFITPRSAAIVWQDIYNFSMEDIEGINFMNILSNGKYNYFKEVMPGIPSASKTGFATRDVVETGIVFDDKPYIAIIIANKGGNIGGYTQVLKLISAINEIMNEYKAYTKK